MPLLPVLVQYNYSAAPLSLGRHSELAQLSLLTYPVDGYAILASRYPDADAAISWQEILRYGIF